MPIPPRILLIGLALLAAVCMLAALAVGSVRTSPGEVLTAFAGTADTLATAVILDLRLPRVLTAFATGGLLALAGVLMQVLLRNPLADPYILGVSGGAAVAALGLMLLGIGGAWIGAGAFGGALLSMLMVFVLARGGGEWTSTRLLLTGVIIAAGWGALISLMLAISPLGSLRGMLFWLMGDLSQSLSPMIGLGVLAAGLLAALPLARSLNLLAHGELQAGALGVPVAPLRIALYGLASLLTATAVATAGSIGFIGLVVPHLLRFAAGGDHRLLLPASALGGGTLLVAADTLARTVIAPQQLPVGVITALIGVPLFLLLLYRGRPTTWH